MNIYQSNTYRKDLCWLHFGNESRVQERQQWKDLQSCIPVFVTYLTIPRNEQSDQLQKGKQVKRYLSHQDQSSQKCFQQFCFIRCRSQHLCIVKQRRYSRLTFVENNNTNSTKVPRGKFLVSDRLLFYQHIVKFGSFKNPFVMITSLPEPILQIQKLYSIGTKEKNDFYELQQQHKQLKTMQMSEA